MEGQEQIENEIEGSIIQDVYKSMIQFNKERLECEKNFQFVEAGKIKDHLKKLGEEYVRVSLNMLRERQDVEKEGLEGEYEKEVDGLNAKWEEELKNNEEDTDRQYAEIQQRQQEEMEGEQERLRKNAAKEIKMSPEILNMEHQINLLVKDQRYNEAAVVQKKLEVLRDKRVQKGSFNMDESIRSRLEAINKRQENEIAVLEKRIAANRENLFKTKDAEFDQLNSRFRVYREKLDNNHINEFIREEKRLKSFNPCANSLAWEE